jgi:hypothetical protein
LGSGQDDLRQLNNGGGTLRKLRQSHGMRTGSPGRRPGEKLDRSEVENHRDAAG